MDAFIEDFSRITKAFPDKNARDCLVLVRIPKTLNGGLTLKSLGELVRNYFPAFNMEQYRYFCPKLAAQLGDRSMERSQWVFMAKDILYYSWNTPYEMQQNTVKRLAIHGLRDYQIPEVLPAAVAILIYYFVTKTRIFSDMPCTYTKCQEHIDGSQAVVGEFAESGLTVRRYAGYVNSFGIAPMRKF